jgi:hypothetical protein
MMTQTDRFDLATENEQKYIKSVWMNEDCYKRYVSMTDNVTWKLDEYAKWFEQQMIELENEDFQFVIKLAHRIKRFPFKLKLMNFESCASFRVGFMFIDMDGSLTLANFC